MKEENNRYREEEKEEEKEEKKEDAGKEESKIDIMADNQKIIDFEIKISELENEVLLARANEINYKRRLDGEKAQAIAYANQNILMKFIDQIDLFASVVNMQGIEDPKLEKFLLGFKMIADNFQKILTEEGVKKIKVEIGEEFNPKYHHPFDTAWDDKYSENAVLAELKSGYIYKDRVLRPTLVKVNQRKEVKKDE